MPGAADRSATTACTQSFAIIPFARRFLSDPSTALLCYIFFYTPLADIYYFVPVPWHVYLFAFHGTALLLGFEETKKHFRRKGYPLEFLG